MPVTITITAQRVVDAARRAGLTVATAESCTGGLVSAAITSVAGASEVFTCGLVTYSNESKHELLGVPREVIEQHGAVSGECAAAMAAGALARSDADTAVAVTGIAGPAGGTTEKPVGTVWFAVVRGSVHAGKAVVTNTRLLHRRFEGDRDAVRGAAVETALGLLLEAVDLPARTQSQRLAIEGT